MVDQDSESLEFRVLTESLDSNVEQMGVTLLALLNDDSLTLADLAQLFRQIQEARRILGDIEKEISQQCAARMDRPKESVEGVGTLERHNSNGRKNWDHDAILARLLALSRDERQVLDEETGEYESEGVAFLRVMKETAGIGYWRVGPLRARGLDPDDFAEKSRGLPYITIRE